MVWYSAIVGGSIVSPPPPPDTGVVIPGAVPEKGNVGWIHEGGLAGL